MDSFFSDKYTAFDGVLLSGSDMSEDMVVPSAVGGQRVKRIISGFSPNARVKTIRLEEGIEEIGDKVFSDAYDVRKLELPASLKSCGKDFLSSYLWNNPLAAVYLKRRFFMPEYDFLCNNVITLSDGRKLLDDRCMAMEAFSGIIENLFVKTPARILPSMKCLYSLGNEKNRTGISYGRNARAEKEFKLYAFEGMKNSNAAETGGRLFRQDIVRLLFDNNPQVQIDEESMRLHDERLQRNEEVSPSTLMLLYYSDSESVTDGESVTVNFHLRFGKVFFPSLGRVVYSGENYYVYREFYLTPHKKHPYDEITYRMVYRKNGSVAPPDIAENVAAKYKLMSMLA